MAIPSGATPAGRLQSHTYYGSSHILRGVSLAISAGGRGPDGPQWDGENDPHSNTDGPRRASGRAEGVLIDSQDATGMPTFRRAQAGLAYVPEERGIFASLSVPDLAIAERRRHRR